MYIFLEIKNMSKNILILGSGMVGCLIAVELHKNHKVTVIDASSENLKSLDSYEDIKKIHRRVNFDDMSELEIDKYDLIVGALPGSIGFKTAQKVLGLGKNYIDISFFPEDPLQLDALAKEKNVVFIPDIGVAPGLSNLVAANYAYNHSINFFKCMVGGLPKTRNWPFEYKAPFSPLDVIEEYIRPARIKRNGKEVVFDPLTEIENFDVKNIGTLECFLSDGLRTLLHTLDIENMEEKTVRYPGYAQKIQMFKSLGFFDEQKIEVDGQSITPREFTSKLLFENWKLGENEEEFTYMRIDMHSDKKKFQFELYDDTKDGFSSMSRTTGYTCTAVAEAFLSGKIKPDAGVVPPEYLVKDKSAYAFILNYLSNKDIKIHVTETEL
ncbi:MAG: saccharopine dehydrogenase [Chitinophagaceae bacterium]|nr:MAG: saccharopine dehydrogenase [Chitinophagaceae bacterium]